MPGWTAEEEVLTVLVVFFERQVLGCRADVGLLDVEGGLQAGGSKG